MYVVVRRMIGEPLNAKDVFVPPVVMLALGVRALTEVSLSGTDLFWIVAGSLVGVVFGAVRASTTVLFERDGVLWQRYSWRTLAVWALSLAAGFGVGLLGARFGLPAEARPIPLSIGVGLLGEAVVVGVRGRAAGVPYARDRGR